MVEGVPDLTPTSSSLDNVTHREEVQDDNYSDESTEFNADEPAGVDGEDVIIIVNFSGCYSNTRG